MRWRDWPCWLRGGIITLIVYVFLFFVLSPYVTEQGPFNLIIIEIPAFPLLIFFGGIESLTSLFFILFIYYFVIGAIIGWIYGKIKKNK